MSDQPWPKRLTVDKRIIRLLSAKTYEDFPGAIRELVSNAYDADATEVKITIDLRKDFIEVTDNGNGMTPSEFDFFLRIAGHEREKDKSPFLRRERIGQFGIGFLSFFPFGKRASITSTSRNSDIQFEAIIPTETYVNEGLGPADIEKISIPGSQIKHNRYRDRHGTTIRLSGLTDLVNLYFKNRESNVTRSNKNSIKSWDPFTRLSWWLGENLPLNYSKDSNFRDAFSDLELTNLRVWLNGTELFRNSVGSNILENDTWVHKDIICRYVIASSWKTIIPYEERGLKQRLDNVGVGDRENFDLQAHGKTYSRLHWVTGEIHIVRGMDQLISIDRSKFYDTPETDKYKEFFRSKLARYSLYLEDVDVAKRTINKQLKDSRGAEVGQKKEIIERNLNVLEKKGFSIVKKNLSIREIPNKTQLQIPFETNTLEQITRDNKSIKTPPIKIDIENRIVEVIDDHPEFIDTIEIDSKIYSLRYVQNQDENAVTLYKDGFIEVNTNYPLFQSKRYGEVFKKLLILLLLYSNSSKSPKDLFERFVKRLPKEFEELY